MIADMDEFVLKCTDNNSKLFIDEAVKSYKAGAYRACINNTWLALVMNITFKIEQLALMNDAEAVKQKELLDKIKERNNISEMLNFERDILKTVREKFEFFDDITLIDLKRIQEDRNRCSHPLLNIDNEPFIPTAELARHHLYLAVEKVISEGNVFGKAAMTKILDLINSPIFSMYYDNAETILKNSYLSSPKRSLVVNLIKVLIKEILNNEKDWRLNIPKQNVLQYLFKYFRDITEETFRNSFNNIIDVTNSLHLKNSRTFFYVDSVIWEILSDDTKIMIQQYVCNLPSDNFEDIDSWLSFEPTKQKAQFRISCANRDELMLHTSFFIVPKEIRERVFELYLLSKNYNEANYFAETVALSVADAEKDEILNFIPKIQENSQVLDSNNLGTILWKIRSRNLFSNDELNTLFQSNGLNRYVYNPIPF